MITSILFTLIEQFNLIPQSSLCPCSCPTDWAIGSHCDCACYEYLGKFYDDLDPITKYLSTIQIISYILVYVIIPTVPIFVFNKNFLKKN